MKTPAISVIIPIRNEFGQLGSTIQSLCDGATSASALEIVVVDDASDDRPSLPIDHCCGRATLHMVRLRKRSGVAKARNFGVSCAQGRVLFITDAHCEFSRGWDEQLQASVRHNNIVAATIADPQSSFRGYGCNLVVPFMGTRWNRTWNSKGATVQIASSAGTALTRQLFRKLGEYDEGMIIYGAAEPEFSVRAWLSGAEVVLNPDVLVFHRFKLRRERNRFLKHLRPQMIHNSLRFGLLYLSELACLQMIRHFLMQFPSACFQALQQIYQSDVWNRRVYLEKRLIRSFNWFADYFALRDQVGNPILW